MRLTKTVCDPCYERGTKVVAIYRVKLFDPAVKATRGASPALAGVDVCQQCAEQVAAILKLELDQL